MWIKSCFMLPSGVGIEVINNGNIMAIQTTIIGEPSCQNSIILNGGDAHNISGCTFEGATHSIIYLPPNAPKDSNITNNWFGDSPGQGIRVDGPGSARLTIANNRFGGCGGPAVTFDRVVASIVSGNRFEDNCVNIQGSHIHLDGCEGINIEGNYFEVSGHCQSAVNVKRSLSNTDCRRILLNGNIFDLPMIHTDNFPHDIGQYGNI